MKIKINNKDSVKQVPRSLSKEFKDWLKKVLEEDSEILNELSTR